jgi:signal transduction histidine kinase
MPTAHTYRRQAWCLAVFGVVLATAIAVFQRGQTFPDALKVSAPAIAVILLISAAISFRRASEATDESKGWRLAGASNICLAFVAPLLSIPSYKPEWYGITSKAAEILTGLSFLFLYPWAFRSWPWRKRALAPHVAHWLGCMIFVGALLLILFVIGAWNPNDAGLIGEVQLVVYLRLAAGGGIVLFLISEDPRRIRGMMGWYLLALIPGSLIAEMLKLLVAGGNTGVAPIAAALPIVGSSLTAAAAWSRMAVEPAEGPAAPQLQRYWEALMGMPMIAAGIALLLRGRMTRIEFLVFVTLAVLSVARQFVLMDQLTLKSAALAQANENLETQVRQRTKRLEDMQAVMLRTEKANTIALLGAGVVHDLNNALSQLECSLHMVTTAENLTPDQRNYLRAAGNSMKQAASLVSRLMKFARHREENPKVLNLLPELTEMQSLLRMVLPRTIELRFELCSGPLWVRAGRSQIEQMVVNLVRNAGDAIEDDGEVVVRALHAERKTKPQAVIEVQDNGMGIPPEVMERIYEPFFTTKDEGRGTGLGLPSVKATVEQLGGRIKVRSEPGLGTIFTLSLPALDEDQP